MEELYQNFRIVMKEAAKHSTTPEFLLKKLNIRSNLDYRWCVYLAIKADNSKMITDILFEYHPQDFVLNLNTLELGLVTEPNETFISCLSTLFFKIDHKFHHRLVSRDDKLGPELLLRAVELNFISQTPCKEFWAYVKEQNINLFFTLLSLDYKMSPDTLQMLLQQSWVRQETRNKFFEQLLTFIGEPELLQSYTDNRAPLSEPCKGDNTPALQIECLEQLIQQRRTLITNFLIDHKCHGPHLLTLQYCGYKS